MTQIRLHYPSIKLVEQRVKAILDEKLPPDHPYHNFDHAMDVYASASIYARLEGLSERETHLLLVAALFHDVGHIAQYDANESIGARIAADETAKMGYGAHDILLVQSLILATQMPQDPKTHMERILCDCDLDQLGMGSYTEQAAKLRKEWEIQKSIVYTDQEWTRLQIEFLSGHKYFTLAAQKLGRNQGKLDNIARLAHHKW